MAPHPGTERVHQLGSEGFKKKKKSDVQWWGMSLNSRQKQASSSLEFQVNQGLHKETLSRKTKTTTTKKVIKNYKKPGRGGARL